MGGTKNAQREKEIDSIVARHAGGISRSGKLASDQKKQQSGQTIHDRSVWEHVRSAIDRIEFSGQSPSSDRVSFFLNETSSFLQSFSEKSTTTQQGAFVQPSPGLETQTEN